MVSCKRLYKSVYKNETLITNRKSDQCYNSKIGYEKFWLKLKDFGQALHCIYAACLRFDRKKDTANAKCSIY